MLFDMPFQPIPMQRMFSVREITKENIERTNAIVLLLRSLLHKKLYVCISVFYSIFKLLNGSGQQQQQKKQIKSTNQTQISFNQFAAALHPITDTILING